MRFSFSRFQRLLQASRQFRRRGRWERRAGVGFKDVAKTTIYITDMSLYSDVSTTYGGYFTDNYPAREMVCVKELPLGTKVEISMIAAKH